MKESILVPYDASESSRQALQAAAETFPEASLVILHVVEPVTSYLEGGSGQQHQQAMETARSDVTEAAESVPAGVTVETEVVTGRPIHEIVRYADTNAVDHIVMGSHGRDGARRLLLGSVAETVIRRASVPVTVVRESESIASDDEHVVVAFDGSAESRAALAYALEQYPAATTTALYVVYPPRETLDDTDTQSWDPAEFTDDILEMAASVAEKADRSVETATTEGKPAAAIVGFVQQNDVDHVVMGSHGRDGLTRLVLGSVAETVVRRSPSSVTVVR